MANNYFNRYVWLLDTIRQRKYITLSELSDLWQKSNLNPNGEPLPARTFHHHQEAIKEAFNIDIKYVKPLGYHIVDEDTTVSVMRDWLMTSMSVNNLINESASLHDRILLEEISSGNQYLDTVIKAMKEGVMLDITYKPFMKPEPDQRTVAPYSLKLYRQRWYMIARKAGRSKQDALHIYALDRVKEMQLTRRHFTMPANFDAKAWFANWFGIVRDENNYKPQKIRLKVWAKQRNYLDSLPLHNPQEIVESNDEWAIYEYFMAPTWDLEQELLQWNDNVEVLAPQSLRDAMIEHAWNMLHLYKEIPD